MLKRRHKQQTAFDKAIEDWANDWSIRMDQEILGIDKETVPEQAGIDATHGGDLWWEEGIPRYPHVVYYINRFSGEVIYFLNDGGLSARPDTHVLCDGRALLVKDERDLFTLIGYKYGGSGDYFHIPDLRSNVI